MISNVVVQMFTFGAAVLVLFGISYGIDIFLYKVKKILVFALPALFLVAGILFFILARLSDNWGALGFIIYAVFSTVAFVGSLLAGLLMWFRKK